MTALTTPAVRVVAVHSETHTWVSLSELVGNVVEMTSVVTGITISSDYQSLSSITVYILYVMFIAI